jgi:hypothetical protein
MPVIHPAATPIHAEGTLAPVMVIQNIDREKQDHDGETPSPAGQHAIQRPIDGGARLSIGKDTARSAMRAASA